MRQVGYFLGWIRGWIWAAIGAGLLLWFLVGNGWGWLAFFAVLALIVGSGLVATIYVTVTGQFEEAKKRCPFCREEVLAEAIKCKHCGSDIGQHEKLKELKAQLQHADHSERIEAVHELQKIGDPAIPFLIDALENNSSWTTRVEAAISLGHLKDPKGFMPLVRALRDENSVVIEMAAYSLAEYDDKRATPYLVSAMRDDPSLMGITQAIVRLDDPTAIPGLIEFMSNSFGIASATVGHALGRFGEKAVPALVEAFNAGDSSTQSSIAHVLEQIGEPAIPFFIDFLKSEDISVQFTAKYHLAKMGEPARTALKQLLKDSNVDVVQRAQSCLDEMDKENAD